MKYMILSSTIDTESTVDAREWARARVGRRNVMGTWFNARARRATGERGRARDGNARTRSMEIIASTRRGKFPRRGRASSSHSTFRGDLGDARDGRSRGDVDAGEGVLGLRCTHTHSRV